MGLSPYVANMKIIRAKHSGFCFGVKKAIQITLENVENKDNNTGRIFTCGQLIHNTSVTDELSRKGVNIINSPSDATEKDTIIVRSHGEPKEFYKLAENVGVKVIDATCPFVSKIHELVSDAYLHGKNIIIVGDREHPEVIGINGWCENSAYIFSSAKEAESFSETCAFLVSQTTLKEETLQEVITLLTKKGVDLEVQNTICNATYQRQKAASNLAEKVDAMIVIGGRNSSNSQKLYEICKKKQNNCLFIEDINDLPLKEFEKCNTIGIAAGASTPERVIKEVISTMSENITNENISMADIMDEIDASLALPRTGAIITGKVDQVNENDVIINMGCKKDGILTTNEVSLEEGQTLSDLFKVGDEVTAKVIKTDDNDGGILLSKKRLEVNEHWNEINEALENKTTIDVKVVRPVKGGVIAAYKEVSGFIPLSQLSNKFVENADEFIGQVLSVKVTRVDQRRNRAVFSHKAILTEERQKQIDEIWETLNINDIVEGTVMRFTDYGAFIDLGGIDGLLHISEISWGKLKHPGEVLEIGQTVNVRILSMNKEKGKISLGLKQTTPEPWSVIEDNYHVGQIVSGKVVQLKEYGAFIELEPGLDGLVHISEVANKRVANIGEELTIGQEVNAKILDIDTERKRISLSIKDAVGEEAPETPAEDTTEGLEEPVGVLEDEDGGFCDVFGGC
ncbi:MAG: bifunctional 4-hydroxy-3-methylbut-2-enyl diphosphate reductase/30S ribosomal protein S1 [Hornefia sp.]|nr:bifunctional 4-hydroxy-3-methylbut-2-enyl diphosphate reductase/30S ribosomal protein S1 [Hornefia sp.]